MGVRDTIEGLERRLAELERRVAVTAGGAPAAQPPDGASPTARPAPEYLLGLAQAVLPGVRGRQAAAWVLVRRAGLSLRQAGLELGADHSTVHHSVQVADGWIQTSPEGRALQRIARRYMGEQDGG